ncbi:hypothetical+protein [Methylocapsa aurea]|uniref:hypothetical protein n=1 Tax=Methylocapsa aurea TaxID=663610 RepID=UPI003D18D04F
MAIGLGDKVRDVVTHFEGIAVSRIEYLTGCVQFGVSPQVGADGKIGDTQYFDDARLETIGGGVAEVIAQRSGFRALALHAYNPASGGVVSGGVRGGDMRRDAPRR